ncbi:MAG: GNAT family N-acetyltransferase [Pseudobdellovibrionaceae bacterium]
MEFRILESREEAQRIFPVIKQLRTHLDESTFLDLLQKAKSESDYTLLAAYEGSECVGLMGFRFLTDFVHGRHLYIDDLVTSESHRSKGLGSQFLQKAKEIAAQNGCQRLRLCTGADNDRGKKFYEKNGWDFRAIVYKAKL